ncbi:MAG: tetratricopeptide repeat protein [Saprospiraceae bacterium]|nr:tetratricopeptide repeat protein [Saprospiraceae bacterium]
MKTPIAFLLFLAIFTWQCQTSDQKNAKNEASTTEPQPEAYTLDGKPLFPSPESEASLQKKDSLLQIARQNFERDSNNLDHIIWLGRRTAYLSRFRESIDIFAKGLETHPNSPELYRHRGHRYISTRQFDQAIADFEKAAALAKDKPVEIEPDGIPNKLNQPLSTLQFNIWYHWALAYYLKGDFAKAAQIYEECMTYSTNPDLLCATADWLYMTYRRLGETEKAMKMLEKIMPDMEIIENESYYNRLLMYKGLKKPEELLNLDAPESDLDALLNTVTQGYGVGNWYLYNGDAAKAKEIFQKVTNTTYWSAFGFIAAEADLTRLD